MPLIGSSQMDDVLKLFKGRQFITKEFINKFKKMYPNEWKLLIRKFGEGGKGCGRNYSANGYIGLRLGNRKKAQIISFIRYTPAPKGWGSPVIALWKR